MKEFFEWLLFSLMIIVAIGVVAAVIFILFTAAMYIIAGVITIYIIIQVGQWVHNR